MKDFESYFKETIMSSFLRVKIRQNKTKNNLEKIFVKFRETSVGNSAVFNYLLMVVRWLDMNDKDVSGT